MDEVQDDAREQTEAAQPATAPVAVDAIDAPGAPQVIQTLPFSHILGRGEDIWPRIRSVLPWISLALSIASAVTLDRSDERGPYVAFASAVGWIVLMLAHVVHRKRDATTTSPVVRVMRVATTTASQSLIQLSLFFCAPFYLQASSFTPAQVAFGIVFSLSALLTLWDPLCRRVLLSPIAGPLLTAFAAFVGLYAALPMLSMPHQLAVRVAAGVVAVSVPSACFVRGGRGSTLASAVLVGVLVPVFLALGGVRAIPPAPLRVVHAAFGTGILARELVNPQTHFAEAPPTLYCFTAVRAPHGLKEGLQHVWSLNGEFLTRIPVELRGGRQRGFRTWSRLKWTIRTHGELRCEVVTPLGQILGATQAKIGP